MAELGVLLKALLKHMRPVTLDEHPRIGNSRYLAFRTKGPEQVDEVSFTQVTGGAGLESESVQTRFEAARALQDTSRYLESIPLLEKIFESNPDYNSAGFWLAFGYQKIGQSQQAVNTYLQFLKTNPGDFQAHFNLAYEFMVENDCKKAVRHFEKVLALRPSYREVHVHLARCYETLENMELSRRHLELSQKETP